MSGFQVYTELTQKAFGSKYLDIIAKIVFVIF